MNSFLFLPVSSLNFNSVFSTESISPRRFYSLRNFGSKRFFGNLFNDNDDLLLLYNFLPSGPPIENEDEFIFYIGISKYFLHDLSIVYENEGRVISSIQDTIQLNFCFPIFIFATLENRKSAVVNSLSAIEVKLIHKYKAFFYTADEVGVHLTPFFEAPVPEFRIPLSPDVWLIRDQKINAFKGLLYSQIVFSLIKKSSIELDLEQSINEINNAWGACISAVGYLREQKKQQRSKTIDNIGMATLMLSRGFENLNKIISRILPGNSVNESIESYIRKSGLNNNDADTFLRLVEQLPEIKKEAYRLSQKQNPSIQYEVLVAEEELNKALRVAQYSEVIAHNFFIRAYEKAEACFKKIQSALLPKPSEKTALSLSSFEYYLANTIIKCRSGATLHSNDVLLRQYILNLLFEHNKASIHDLSQDFLSSIIIDVGNKVTELFGEESVERKQLILFYNYFIGKAPVFDIRSLQSPVLANFCVFVQKPIRLEECIVLCEKQHVQLIHLTLEFWCTFNGFSSIGKMYLEKLWEAKNFDFVSKIDSYLKGQLVVMLPYLSNIPDVNPIKLPEQKQNALIQEREPDFDDLLDPIKKNNYLSPHYSWIEHCIETCTLSLLIEYEDADEVESLKKNFELELFGKNRPKGFTVSLHELTMKNIDFDLFYQLKKKKHGF